MQILKGIKNLKALHGWEGFSKALALGVALLSMSVWVGCQQADMANSDSGKSGSASGVMSMAKPSNTPTSGEHWLGDSATCKDKGPAAFGIAFKCTDAQDPVCGCDGKTYANYCQAWGIGGINVEHKGACVQDTGKPIICGTPDPGNGPDPVETPHTGNPSCGDPIPSESPRCTNESHPVCGCDGKTYVNGCLALTARVNVQYAGACTTGAPTDGTPIHYIK